MCLMWMCVLWTVCVGSAVGQPVFRDVTAEVGIEWHQLTGSPQQRYIVDSLSGGAAFFDCDNDGDLDLYLVNGSTWETLNPSEKPRNVLYRNDGKFVDVTEKTGTGDTGWGMGALAFDYDNDGNLDLYVSNWGSNVLYRNDGNFVDVTDRAGVGGNRWSAGCAVADYDNDGDLDLYVVNHVFFDPANPPNGGKPCLGYRGLRVYCGPQGLPAQADVLYRNEGDGTFVDVSDAVGMGDVARYGLGAVWTDYDDDGDADLFVSVDSQANLLYQNNGPWPGGRFVDVALTAGVAYSADGQAQAGMGVAAGDYNADGRMDLFVTHFSDDYNTLYQNDGGGFFTDVTWSTGLGGLGMPFLGWGTSFLDCDNDGDRDLFVANGHIFPEVERPDLALHYAQTDQLLLNAGGRFEDVSLEAGLVQARVSRGAAFGDYDNDGDVDVLVVNLNDRPTLLCNETDGIGSWVKVMLEGVQNNRQGVGARVTVVADGFTQVDEVRGGGSYLSDSDRRLHFGLGTRQVVDRIEVRWPGGGLDVIKNVPVNRLVVVREGAGGRVVLLNKN